MSICCCAVLGRPVYGITFLLYLHKISLTAESAKFFTVTQKAPAESNFILPKTEITDCRLLLSL